MPTVSFEGETHDEIVRKVRRWLASIDGEEGSSLSAVEGGGEAPGSTQEGGAGRPAAAPGVPGYSASLVRCAHSVRPSSKVLRAGGKAAPPSAVFSCSQP